MKEKILVEYGNSSMIMNLDFWLENQYYKGRYKVRSVMDRLCPFLVVRYNGISVGRMNALCLRVS